jgi:hypothetical protein
MTVFEVYSFYHQADIVEIASDLLLHYCPSVKFLDSNFFHILGLFCEVTAKIPMCLKYV